MDLSSIPDLPLVCILKHLALDDVKLCRLVCQQWHKCSLFNDVADKFQLTFCSHIQSTEEMNTFLISTRRTRLDVQFIGVQLKELNFEAFGSKLKDLVITNCFAGDKVTLKNVFRFTPNIRSLHLSLANQRNTGQFIWERALVLLLLEGFSNNNLEIFYCDWKLTELEALSIMFPRLSKIVCSSLSIVAGMPLPILTRPHLTEITASIFFHIHSNSTNPTSAYLQCFSELVNLKLISTNVDLLFYQPAENIVARESLKQSFYRDLLYCLLKNCSKLQSVCVLVCTNEIDISSTPSIMKSNLQLQPNEYPEFLQLISRVKYLYTGDIISDDVGVFREALTVHGHNIKRNMRSLGDLSETPGDAQDLRLALLELCPNLEVLDLCVDVFQLNLANLRGDWISNTINLADVVHSKKNLNSLYLTITAKHAVLDKVDPASYESTGGPMVIQHEKLERLEFRFTSHSIHHLTSPNSSFGTLWNFPNLISIGISFVKLTREPLPQDVLSEFRKNILRWIDMMPTSLQQIMLPCYRWTCMSVEEITTICMAQTKLIRLRWASVNYPDAAKIIELYAQHCQKLQILIVFVYNSDAKQSRFEMIEYRYCRLTQVLYKATLQQVGQRILPSPFTLV